ncbi:pyridoxamine 5'-phosphate oxidase family protein [Thermomonospora umbrina]|uniref:Pyridoxamine 5'-phosphate oxidase n=1 Tax=Thermomonospora umbrina TaxID=111806 RepID=A0A3D9SZB4_9ACTN|nr:pyridoxamine 5'-phosphate oxidase family protein [Thermomonospora umbrina]REE96961.1 pyridoxamine 5'-phosphate oxidase [Thermomonospora umbrina]
MLPDPVETVDLNIYGDDELPWSRVQEALKALPKMETAQFLGTVGSDGRPHSAGIGCVAHDGNVFFTSGPTTRKQRRLEENPACTLSFRLPGVDLVLEGDAHRETDPAVLATVAALYREEGWPAEADGDALTAPYSAQSAGPPPWYLYRFTAHIAVGVATAAPHGATRWRFARG